MEQKAALRRKVLRGSLAAPVVLTVSSASVAASSFARCLARTTDTTAVSNTFFATDTDHWFRAQVPVTGLWSHGQDLGYFYNDPVKNVFVSVNPPYLALPFNAYEIPPNVKVTTQSTRWALVWFDKASTTQYAKISLQQPSGSTASSLSCYGSFNKG